MSLKYDNNKNELSYRNCWSILGHFENLLIVVSGDIQVFNVGKNSVNIKAK